MRKIILSSLLSILLCAVLIVGTTFALFTSETTLNVAVTSATVEVKATVDGIALSSSLANGNLPETTAVYDQANSNTITLTNIVPGDTVSFEIVITNTSTVAVDYRTVFTLLSDDGLWSGLEVTVNQTETVTDGMATGWATLGNGETRLPVKITLPEGAGNEYQTKSIALSYYVEAIQGNHDDHPAAVNP